MRKAIIPVCLACLLALMTFVFSMPQPTIVHAQCALRPCGPGPGPGPGPAPKEPIGPAPEKPDRPDPEDKNPSATSVPIPTPAPTAVPEATVIARPMDTPAPPEPSIEPPAIIQPIETPSPVVISVPLPVVTQAPPPAIVTFPDTLVLNEYLAASTKTGNDTWIEIYNNGESAIDLGDWQIAHTANGGASFVIPIGTTIAPHGYRVFLRSETGLDLDAQADQVQLINPAGKLADWTSHTALQANRPNARSVDGGGTWTPDCKATPDAANCSVVAGASNYFPDHIADPTLVGSLDVAVLMTNALLALILALAMGFFSNMLNDILETHEEGLARFLAPIRPLVDGGRRATARFDEILQGVHLAWLGFAIKLAIFLALYGVIFAYLDPNFSITSLDGWLLILALALSAGLIGVIDDVAQYLYLRAHGSDAVIRVHGGNFLVAIVSALFSRFSGLTPGLLFGNPAGIEEVSDPEFELPSHLLALGAMGGAALLAWLLSPFVGAETWLRTVLLLIFAVGIQSVFFEMLPIKYLHGRGIYEFNRWVWVAAFALVTTIFFQTMLNPDGDFIRAFQQSNVITLSIIVIVFCVGTSALWFYLNRPQKATA